MRTRLATVSLRVFLSALCIAAGFTAARAGTRNPIRFVGPDVTGVTRVLVHAGHSSSGFRALGPPGGSAHPLYFSAPPGYELSLVGHISTSDLVLTVGSRHGRDRFAIYFVNWSAAMPSIGAYGRYSAKTVLSAVASAVQKALPRGYHRVGIGGGVLFEASEMPTVEVAALCCLPGTPSFRILLTVFVPGADILRVEKPCVAWVNDVPHLIAGLRASCAPRWFKVQA